MQLLAFHIFVLGSTSDAVMQVFIDVLLPVIVTAIGGLLTTVLLKLNSYLRAKVGLSSVDFATAKLDSVIPAIVAEADATIVAGLRDANADGKITADEARAVMDAVIAKVKQQLGAAGFDELKQHLGVDADALLAMIRSRIEASVDARKRELSGPVVATATATTPDGASATVSVPSSATESAPPRSLSTDGPARPAAR